MLDNPMDSFLDPDDQDLLAKYNWYLMGVDCSTGATVNASMHRLVMERVLGRPLERGEIVDHINGDGWDNRRENLRCATSAQNMRNRRPNRAAKSSSYKGVKRRRDDGRWIANIQVNDQRTSLGSFYHEKDAAIAYDSAAHAAWGEYAWLNLPDCLLEYRTFDEAVKENRAKAKREWAEMNPTTKGVHPHDGSGKISHNCPQCGLHRYVYKSKLDRGSRYGLRCGRICAALNDRRHETMGLLSGFCSDGVKLALRD